MFIAKAFAAGDSAQVFTDMAADAPSPAEALMYNIGLVLMLVGLFYILLILPQQRRFKEHNAMLSGLKKGDRVVTGGGLVGKIEKEVDDKEVIIDLGNDIKVTALRAMLQGKSEPHSDGKAKDVSGQKKKAKKE
ncbi:MAG: preprotein translocase subunit YajC [Alphaproteobacteria bacterium]